MRFAGALAIVLSVTQLGGCGAGYYWQAAMGHLDLMRDRRPIAEVIDDPATPVQVREKLQLGNAAVDFAHTELQLPDNGSYRVYADTGRASVVWNVVAAPEFSLEPRTWCFPVAGCVSYRGYFDAARARDYAARLASGGDDVFVGGVSAYSTLGRFADPILNTMLDYADYQLAGVIFHELAHQRLYIKGDSRFNEGFASFVEQEGLRRWFIVRDAEDEHYRYRLSMRRRTQVQSLLTDSRARLTDLYAGALPEPALRVAKAEVFAELIRAYASLRDAWPEPPYFDHWIDSDMNNARLASFATYNDYLPAFAVLFDESGHDLERFYARAEALGELATEARTAAMERRLAVGRDATAGRSTNLQQQVPLAAAQAED
ncbi:MAG: aminopeptidase [Gammaproteobacteria bacterium]|nr:MAG: aminopeptidase [Gammaproteobacteria bacterium]